MSNEKISSPFFEENIHQKMQKYLQILQPSYDRLISRFSKSYLSGSDYYIGDNLLNWWNNYNVKLYNEKKKKLEYVIEIILLDKENNT